VGGFRRAFLVAYPDVRVSPSDFRLVFCYDVRVPAMMFEGTADVTQQEPRSFGFDARWGGFGYVVMCTISLAAMIILLRPGISKAAQLAYFVFGSAGIVLRVSVTPILMVMSTGVLLVMPHWGLFGDWSPVGHGAIVRFEPRDLLLAVAMLGFVVGHYRLQAVGRFVFPPDYRFAYLERARAMPAELWRLMAEKRRGADLVKPTELLQTAASLPIVVVIAQAAGTALGRARGFLDWGGPLSRVALVMTVMSLGFFTVRSLLRLWYRRTMGRDEAFLSMQDVLWQELRSPVQLLSRWLVWQRLPRE
jgi:hypothetical protein